MPIINFYNNGITNDSRDTAQGVCQMCTNFDINTSPRKLIPYRKSEDGDSSASTRRLQAFCIGTFSGTSYLYGLGVVSGQAYATIVRKDLSTGGSADLSDNTWTGAANGASASGSTFFDLFIYYPKVGKIYGAKTATGIRIWEYDPAVAFNEDDIGSSVGSSTITNGVVHTKDDILYVGVDNKIIKNDNGTWTSPALTLPSQFKVTSICEFNNYLAIAVAPTSGLGNSYVYLWDRSSTLATVDESIDWGYGTLNVLEELDGYLVGISISNSGITHKNKITFRYYTGAGAQAFKEIIDQETGTQTTALKTKKQKIGNRVHFLASIYINGARRQGVWSFGRNQYGIWTVSHERTPNNDTAVDTGQLLGFFYAGDYLFQSYIASSTYGLSKTDDQATYTNTAIYETVINPNMADSDKPLKKQLKSIAITYTTLSAVSGQVVVKFKVQGGSYTTLLTATTTGYNTIEQVIDSSTGLATTSFRDCEFRIESTLGAEVISLKYDYEVLETLIN